MMPLLVRKVADKKWDFENKPSIDKINADAITNCMKTTTNTLSVWEIECHDQFNDAIVAFVAACEKIERMAFVCFDKRKLINANIEIAPEKADTAYVSYADKHRNIIELDYGKLGIVASCINDALFEGNDSLRVLTGTAIKALIREYLLQDKIDINKCKNADINKIYTASRV